MSNHPTHKLSKVTVAFWGPERKKEIPRKVPEQPVVGIVMVLNKSRELAASETESFSHCCHLVTQMEGSSPVSGSNSQDASHQQMQYFHPPPYCSYSFIKSHSKSSLCFSPHSPKSPFRYSIGGHLHQNAFLSHVIIEISFYVKPDSWSAFFFFSVFCSGSCLSFTSSLGQLSLITSMMSHGNNSLFT